MQVGAVAVLLGLVFGGGSSIRLRLHKGGGAYLRGLTKVVGDVPGVNEDGEALGLGQVQRSANAKSQLVLLGVFVRLTSLLGHNVDLPVRWSEHLFGPLVLLGVAGGLASSAMLDVQLFPFYAYSLD